MIDLIVDYDLTSKILENMKERIKRTDMMEYDDFKKEINEYGIKTTLNKYDLHKFITKDKPLAYFMLLWDRVHRGWSDPHEVFSEIDKYRIIDYNYQDNNDRPVINYDLLRIYVDELFSIKLENLDNRAVGKLFRMMNSDDKVVLLKEGVAVFAW